MNNQDTHFFDVFGGLRVLIVGDVMLDSYVWGRVERISPEAPVPVVNVQKRSQRLGGAANVALNVASLGAIPVLCSVIGQDTAGEQLTQVLVKHNVSIEGLIMSTARPTTIKERVIASAQHIVRIDTETDSPIADSEQQLLLKKIEALLPSCHVVLFQDYDKGVLSEMVITQVIQWANARNIPTVVDPKKRNFLAYQNVTLFKPNLKELKEGLKVEFDVTDVDELQKNITLLKQKLNAKGVFVTLSERGVYIDFKGEQHHVPAYLRQIADVSGAGDTVVSIAACALAVGLAPRPLAQLANLGGGLVCEQVGVVPIDVQRLKNEYKSIKSHGDIT